MGQKVRPTGFRTGIMIPWLSNWYANKRNFSDLLIEDHKIRKYIKKRYPKSGIARIRIERTSEKVVVFVYSAKVGTIIDFSQVEQQALARYTQDAGNHVSIELHPAAALAIP